MKKTGINLLYQSGEDYQKLRRVMRTSFVVLGLFIAVVILLFAATLLFNFQKQSLESQKAKLVSEVGSFKEEEGLYQTIKNRLDISRVIYAKSQSSQHDLVKKLATQNYPGMRLQSIVSNQENRIVITASAANSSSLVSFIAQLRGSGLNYLAIGSLTQSDNSYTVSLSLK